MRDIHQKKNRSRRSTAPRKLFRASTLIGILLLAFLSCQMPGYSLVLANSAFGSATRYATASISSYLSSPTAAPEISESAMRQIQTLMDEKKSVQSFS
jgi:hypothetical protein